MFARRFLFIPLAALAFCGATPHVYDAMQWRLIGPFRGGRTVAVSGVPSQRGVFYMAPTDGGVWKSTDYGRTWQPIFEYQDTGSVGALAVAPSDPQIVYVGSGEGLRRPDLSVGDGIYKSSDAGKTWTHLGLRDGQQINALAVDPRNPNRVFAAVMGHPYGPNAQRGLYRSLDGGANWTKVLGTDGDTGASTVVIDPNDPNVLYANLWASRNPPWRLADILQLYDRGGLFKSSDGGTTWTQLKSGLPSGMGRAGIAVAKSDSHRVYAWVNEATSCGIYRSSDAGASFVKVDGEDRICGRGDDFSGIAVDPVDPDEVYVTNTTTYRSSNGGASWTGIKGAPGGDDYHTVWIDPSDRNIIVLGADQGATLSVNGGETWSLGTINPRRSSITSSRTIAFPIGYSAASRKAEAPKSRAAPKTARFGFATGIPSARRNTRTSLRIRFTRTSFTAPAPARSRATTSARSKRKRYRPCTAAAFSCKSFATTAPTR